MFDIKEFHPSIFKDTRKHLLNTMHSRKSLLVSNMDVWVKKDGDKDFDATKGSFDGAETCELYSHSIHSS